LLIAKAQLVRWAFEDLFKKAEREDAGEEASQDKNDQAPCSKRRRNHSQFSFKFMHAVCGP